jgi:uncharacterized protein (TIGR03067 family)
MDYLLEVALSNAIVVTGMAIVVYLVTRLVRNPALCHGLWLLVLVKFITPPLAFVPLPASWGLVRQSPGVDSRAWSDIAESISPVEAGASTTHLAPLSGNPSVLEDAHANGMEPASRAAAVDGAALAPDLSAQETRRLDALRSVLLGVWLSGTVLVALTTGMRIYWFRRLLRLTGPVPADVQEEVRGLAAQIGVRPCPNLYVLPAAVGPMLWAVWGKPTILFPAGLLAELGGDARRTILLHELSHLRRRDHWVRILEVVVTTLFWWHPVVWWARREIRPLEEACCDSFVVSELPDSRQAYATALVHSLRSLGRLDSAFPPAASGIGSLAAMKQRVTMIMIGPHQRWLSGPGRLVLVLAASVCLPLLPAPSPGEMSLPGDETTVSVADPLPLRLYDEFDGKFELDWSVVRPAPTHVSFTRKPGKLTITTQEGSIYRANTPSAKNLHLIRNPVADGSDFVLTTCIESFAPTMAYQQAGLLVYDDDDNYLKCDIEFGRSTVRFMFLRETDGEAISDLDRTGVDQERTWIRIIKRGKAYERSYSADGRTFVSAGAEEWGDGDPKWIGLFAKNATQGADETDAAFDFFEFRSLTSAKGDDAPFTEEEGLAGTWAVVSLERNGKRVEDLPYLCLTFDGREVIVHEDSKLTRMQYTLDATRQPELMMAPPLLGPHGETVSAAYSVDGNELQICYDPRPGSTMPSRLETNPGDARFLFTLRRSQPDTRFVKMDVDRDDSVSLSEFADEFHYLSQYDRLQGVFVAIDRNGNGRLSLQEFVNKSQEALFLMRDYNGDRKLSLAEIMEAKKSPEQIAAAKEEFIRNDEDEDGFLLFKEVAYRPTDADFWKADRNGDCVLSLSEFETVQSSRSSDEVDATFRSIDTNGDGSIGLAEFQIRSTVNKPGSPSEAS